MADVQVQTPSRRKRIYILAGLFATGFVTLAFLAPMPLPAGYHEFVDHRKTFGIPNGFDVLSNSLFFIVGALGVVFLLGRRCGTSFRSHRERAPYLVFFVGVALTGLGSAYYHLAPGNGRLVWDLLPMTFSFVSLVAATIMERVSTRAGLRLLIPLIGLGAASVFYWYMGELQGRGDLRFYLYAQFFSAVAIAVTVLLFRPTYSGSLYLGIAFALYVLAKLFELSDKSVYSMGGFVSGHTLKHLTAGVACYWILLMLKVRRPLETDIAQRRVVEPVATPLPKEVRPSRTSDAWRPTPGPGGLR